MIIECSGWNVFDPFGSPSALPLWRMSFLGEDVSQSLSSAFVILTSGVTIEANGDGGKNGLKRIQGALNVEDRTAVMCHEKPRQDMPRSSVM